VGVDARATADFAASPERPDILRATATLPDAAKLQKLVHPETTWGEFIVVDAALDQGNLDLAKQIIDGCTTPRNAPPPSRSVSRACSATRTRRGRRRSVEETLSRAKRHHAHPRRTHPSSSWQTAAAKRRAAFCRSTRPCSAPWRHGHSPTWTRPGPRSRRGAVALDPLDPPPDGAPLVLRTIAALALASSRTSVISALADPPLPQDGPAQSGHFARGRAAKGIKAAVIARPKKR